MLSVEQIETLAQKKLLGTIDAREQQLLQEWLDRLADEQLYWASADKNEADLKKRLYDRIRKTAGLEYTPTAHRVHFLKTSWFRYAAAVVVLLGGVGSYFWLNHTGTDEAVVVNPRPATGDIQPGTNRAVLTIGNNQPIDLSNSKTGIAVGNAITYNDGERIAEAGQLLQLATPRGGQYQAVLPDGTKVWLNAASSIRFPSRFVGDTREVEIDGEAYLEVAQSVKQSFVVKAGGTEIQVLGTSFNVNAYADEEAVRTTLIEGSVKVKAGERESLLKPGQQASVDYKDHSLIKSTVHTDEVLAWKEGYFNLQGLQLQEVARQLERWYDIEVKYEGDLQGRTFSGKLGRGIRLSTVLNWFSESGIRNRLQGRTLILSAE